MAKHVTPRTVKRIAVDDGAEWLSLDSIAFLRANCVLGGADALTVAKHVRQLYGRTEAEQMLTTLVIESALQPDLQDYVKSILHSL